MIGAPVKPVAGGIFLQLSRLVAGPVLAGRPAMGHLSGHQAGPLWQPIGCDVGLIVSAAGPDAPNRFPAQTSSQVPEGRQLTFRHPGLRGERDRLIGHADRLATTAGRLAGFQYLRARGGSLLDTGGQHACGQERTSLAFRRNLAGAFTLVGCAAAILGEVEAIVEYMRLTPPRSRADD